MDASPIAPRVSTSPKTLKPWTTFCNRDPATTRSVFTSLWRPRNRVGFINWICWSAAVLSKRIAPWVMWRVLLQRLPSSLLWMLNNAKRTLWITYSLPLDSKVELVLPARAEEPKVLYSYIVTIISQRCAFKGKINKYSWYLLLSLETWHLITQCKLTVSPHVRRQIPRAQSTVPLPAIFHVSKSLGWGWTASIGSRKAQTWANKVLGRVTWMKQEKVSSKSMFSVTPARTEPGAFWGFHFLSRHESF